MNSGEPLKLLLCNISSFTVFIASVFQVIQYYMELPSIFLFEVQPGEEWKQMSEGHEHDHACEESCCLDKMISSTQTLKVLPNDCSESGFTQTTASDAVQIQLYYIANITGNQRFRLAV